MSNIQHHRRKTSAVKALRQLTDWCRKLFGSRHAFTVILLLVAVQGLWYALSFQPALFDESKHFEKTVIHSQTPSPFLGEQQPEWDHTGAVSRDGAFLFYFLTGRLLNIISFFTDDISTQLIWLRLACLLCFVAGFYVYRKMLLASKLPGANAATVNIVLLFFALTPAYAPLFGALNYDSLVFLLFGYILLLIVQLINQKKLDATKLTLVVALALLTSVVKWTAIAHVAPAVLAILITLVARHGLKGLFAKYWSGLKTAPLLATVVSMGLLVVGAALFVERPVMNTFSYGKPDPACAKVIDYDRCMSHPDFAIYEAVAAKKPANFAPVSVYEYLFSYWLPRMIDTQTTLLPWNSTRLSPSLPVMHYLYFSFAIVSVLAIFAYLRILLRYTVGRVFGCIIMLYVAILFVFLYSAYRQFAIPAAISARYLLPIYPLYLMCALLAIGWLLAEYRQARTLLFVATLLLFTQGGGIITQLLLTPTGWYRQDETVREANTTARSVIRPLVKE
ncbi:hypothetical protein CR983_02745 [Candidatus Saccharibacteria bacterium]|nr:MAG: hypothetical protein CR983_02745 [Candidatus Saccharibacteria bacterium]